MSATPPPAVSWESPDQLTGPAPGVEYAPHGARLVAYLLDGLFISILAGIPLLIGFILLGAGATIQGDKVTAVDPGATAAFFVLTIVSGVIAFFYFGSSGCGSGCRSSTSG